MGARRRSEFSSGIRARPARTLDILFAAGSHGDAYPFDARARLGAHILPGAPESRTGCR